MDKKYDGFKQDETKAKAMALAAERRAEQNAAGGVLTNEVFAVKDRVFRQACDLAEIKPTGRQAGKYRRGEGKAFSFKRDAVAFIAAADKAEAEKAEVEAKKAAEEFARATA